MTTTTAQSREILAASRLDNVRYAIRDLAVLADEVAKTGKKILMLNIGDPLKFDFATPPHMIEAVHKAMRDGFNGYAASSGTAEALRAIRGEAARKGIGNVLDAFVTSGVSEAVDICFSALMNPDENVLCPSPEYPLYTAIVAKMGLKPNAYDLKEENGWEPDLDDIRRKITPKTRGLVCINPNNPTGAVYSRPTLEALAEIARAHHLVVFADEIYEKMVLEGTHQTFAALAPDIPVVTFGGLSKNYLVPGWRIGWGIVSGPEAVARPYVEGINRLLRARLCASHPMMFAIKAALEGPQTHIAETNAKLKRRRDLTMQWATSTPRVSCVKPCGAFYIFPKLDISEPDEDFVKKLLVEEQVLVVHGSGFGEVPGTKHIRIVYLPDEATLTQAYAKIAGFMKRHYA
jgi:alanine-synthesizing transaminase